jgi:hypothetical protein
MDVGLSQNMGSDPAVFHGIGKKVFGLEAKKRKKYKRDGAVCFRHGRICLLA